jgi:hypothetical protein
MAALSARRSVQKLRPQRRETSLPRSRLHLAQRKAPEASSAQQQ